MLECANDFSEMPLIAQFFQQRPRDLQISQNFMIPIGVSASGRVSTSNLISYYGPGGVLKSDFKLVSSSRMRFLLLRNGSS